MLDIIIPYLINQLYAVFFSQLTSIFR